MSDLERAQEWLNCWRETHDLDCCGGVCGEHPWSPWPCTRAQALARSLTEVAAEALRDAADAWSDWDALSAPEDWLRDRANEVSRRTASVPPRKEPTMTTDRPVVVNPEAIGDPDQTPVVQLPPGATDATPPAASTSPPRSDADAESASEDVTAPPGPSAAFLARAQEWLECDERNGECGRHDGAWPCWDARDLAALLADVAADELERAATEYPAHVRSEDEFWSYNTTSDAVEEIGVEYLTNRAEEVRRG